MRPRFAGRYRSIGNHEIERAIPIPNMRVHGLEWFRCARPALGGDYFIAALDL